MALALSLKFTYKIKVAQRQANQIEGVVGVTLEAQTLEDLETGLLGRLIRFQNRRIANFRLI